MKHFLIILLVAMAVVNCSEKKVDPQTCSVKATVVDLTGLDGCGFVFELEDGTRLLPEHRTYVQAPTKEDDPIYHYQFNAGAVVNIGFVESSALSACMAGQMVFITCITNLPE